MLTSRIGISAIILLLVAVTHSATAQRKQKPASRDSLLILQPGMDTTGLSRIVEDIVIDSTTINRPKVAAYYAAALPGLGQVYNGSYWKLPIVYGAGITMGHFINWNHNKYIQYRQALFDKSNGNDSNPLANAGTQDELERGVDYYRRNRDFLMILMGGLYLLQIVDAHVEAHLKQFEISEDLSFRIRPIFRENNYPGLPVNFGIVLTFNSKL